MNVRQATIAALLAALGLVAFTGCGGDDDEADATTAAPTTTAPKKAGTTTTERSTTTTERPTTTTAAPTTTRTPATTTAPDPLTAAMTAAGYAAPDTKARAAFQTFCEQYTAKNAELINQVAGKATTDPNYVTLVQTAFGVLCPENVALVGTAVMPNGDPVFPGYPLIVDIGSVDNRVGNWDKDKTVDGQLVAVAPGVYAVYNPNVPDLLSYIAGPSDGDCAMRHQYFDTTGGACWDGVQKGTNEP